MKKTLKIFYINIIILSFLLVIIDPFLSEKEVPQSKIIRNVLLREHSPNEDIEETPSDDNIKTAENLEQKAYHLRTDTNGFIIGNSERNKKHPVKDSLNIIFFGGSTTECLYVDEDKRFPYLVGEKLSNKESGLRINTFNAGMGGNCSIHSIINLLAKGIPLNPKIVILMHNINDLSLLTKTGSYWKAPTSRSIIQEQIKKTTIIIRIKNFIKSIKDLLIPNITTVRNTNDKETVTYYDKMNYKEK